MSKGDYGFIKLFRGIMDWGWYPDSNTTRLFIHCLLKANYTEKEWQGIKIPIGSFITSYDKLARELNLTKKEIRTALKHLKMSHEITHKGTRQYSIITVNNYIEYQGHGTQNNKQITRIRHTEDTQWATTNKRNNERNNNIHEIFKKLEKKYSITT